MSSGDSPLPDKIAAGPSGEESRWTWLARIRRPQGRKGEVFADVLTDFPDKFAARRQLWLLPDPRQERAPKRRATADPYAVTLAGYWLHKGGVVLHFAGVDSISQAEELTGLIVAIPAGQRATVLEDEVYISDLVGCTLMDIVESKPVAIGEIEDVDRTAGPVPLLLVRGAGPQREVEILIPFAKSYLRKIDFESRRVEMELPKGLVNLEEADEA